MYTLTDTSAIFRVADSALIPATASNIDYQQYLAWVALGNTPGPYVPPPAVSEIELGAATIVFKTAATEAFRINGNQQVSGLKVTELNSGPLAGFRNYLINGDFSVWQRGTSDTALSIGYMADRWSHSYAQSALVSRQAFSASGTHPGNSQYVLRASGDATASTSRLSVGQCIEGVNSIPLRGKTVTLSFCVKFSAATIAAGAPGNWYAVVGYGTGTADAGFQSTNLISVLTLVATVAQGALPTVWTKYSGQVTIGATATNVAAYFQFQTVADLATTDYYEISQAQLEIGTVATPFEFRPYSVELALCRSFARKQAVWVGTSSSHTCFPIDMRGTPTSISGGGTGFASTNTTADTLDCYQTTAALQTLLIEAEI